MTDGIFERALTYPVGILRNGSRQDLLGRLFQARILSQVITVTVLDCTPGISADNSFLSKRSTVTL
jgi:hypothetical protein